MPSFLSGTPDYCPGESAVESEAVLYRACDTIPPTPEDVTSHAHSKLPRKSKRANPEHCNSWGLSVWVSTEDVHHAMKLHDKWLPKKHIHKFEVANPDGRLAQTGTPPHHTFWPYDGVDLLSRLEPVQL
jgi:hypothetical protein